jgi:hypothetical protein
MGQFLRINGDYNIKAGEGSIIKLDTGPASSGGQVLVTGDLVVLGEKITVSATEFDVKDNIITLNKGELGTGVTLVYAGLDIDRGSEDHALFVYDDTGAGTGVWTFAHGIPTGGGLDFDNSAIRVRRILTDPDTDSGNLTLINNNAGVVNVGTAVNYRSRVLTTNDIPNKEYVDLAIQNNPTFQIVANVPNPYSLPNSSSRVVVSDKEIDLAAGYVSGDPSLVTTAPGSVGYFKSATGYNNLTYGGPVEDRGLQSAVSILVDGILSTQFFPNRVEVGDLEIGGGETRSEITTKDGITNENIFIRTQGTGKLETNYAIQLDYAGNIPTNNWDNATVIYSATPDLGASGVWFVNESTTPVHQQGELISKHKALIFSMLF